MRRRFAGYLTASISTRVPFHDLDPTGVVWHGRYFKYLEGARCALLESLGYSYDAMLESGFLWPVVDSQIKYVHPLTLNQEVKVIAFLTEWEFKLTVDYQLENEDGQVCTRARTVQVPVDAATTELRLGCPPVFVQKVEEAMQLLNRQAG